MEETKNTETTAIDRYSALRQKVDHLLSLEKITPKDTAGMTELEREYLKERVDDKLNELKDTALDKFIEKIELIIPANSKRDIWEHNHVLIRKAISKLMGEYGSLPSKNAIMQETGLSRQTIFKHLKTYKENMQHSTDAEEFELAATSLLASVYKTALKGDTKAARLYLQMTGALNRRPSNTVVNEQTNNIQINNTILSQENLKRLSKEQLEQIERIIMNSKTIAI